MNVHVKCSCKCEWTRARKLNSRGPIEILFDDLWIPCADVKIGKQKFVKSPIALIPKHGYAGKDNHSTESLQWLSLVQKVWHDSGKNIHIQHARNQGEKTIICQGKARQIKYKVDGYFEYDGERYVCEYNGCNFHGCIHCYPRDRETTMNDYKSMAQRYRETCLKEERLQNAGYKVLSKWSREFALEKKKEPIKRYIDSLGLQEPINLRDCYYGGRTNALVLHKIFKDGERGYYVDFTSLYI